MAEKNTVNPWTWQDRLGFSQARSRRPLSFNPLAAR